MVGGAVKTEYPFAKAPGLPQSTGAVGSANPWERCLAAVGRMGGLSAALMACCLAGMGWLQPLLCPTPSPVAVHHSLAHRSTACPCRPSGPCAGAYLLGVMPPELLQLLQLDLPLYRRDPHYFLPSPGAGGKYLLFGSDQEETRRQFLRFFSQAGRGQAGHVRGGRGGAGGQERGAG